jgi:hypothetical protein
VSCAKYNLGSWGGGLALPGSSSMLKAGGPRYRPTVIQAPRKPATPPPAPRTPWTTPSAALPAGLNRTSGGQAIIRRKFPKQRRRYGNWHIGSGVIYAVIERRYYQSTLCVYVCALGVFVNKPRFTRR